ncbi:MAG: carboxypeptidase regulatory-like domain-containing protein [Sedimentisphaerales bacterium]|nr:carboxypeptidase regulatory-like domain-containing protein [Sedimentisphaerales bacterium]
MVSLLVGGPGVRAGSAAMIGTRVTFSGRVVDISGQPISGAEVELHEMTGGVGTPSGYEIELLERMTTGPDGAFSFETDAAGTYRQAMIVARKEGLALGWGYWGMREDQQHDFRLTDPGQVSGTVVGAQDRPLPGVTVFVAAGQIGTRADGEHYLLGPLSRRLLTAQADASGRFVLDCLSADATFELGAEKAGYATMATFDRSSRAEGLQFAPGKTDLKLVMEPEACIEGQVVRQDGAPLEDVPVAIRGQRMVPYLLPNPARSQADGTFRFDRLLADTYTIGLAVPEEDLAEWVATPVQVTLEAGQAETDVVVKAGKGGLVEFVITDAASGQAINQARVGTRRTRDGQWFYANSNENGIARLRLSPGGYHLTSASKTGYSRDPEGRQLAVAEGQTQRMSLSLEATPRLTGVLRDQEGRPVAGAAVSILPGGRTETVSDTQGRYEMSWDPGIWGEGDATFCLLIRHVQRNLAAAVEMAADTQSLDVTLQPGMTLCGKVLDPDGQPVANPHVFPMLHVSNWGAPIVQESVRIEADGTFEVPCLPRNMNYSIEAYADGYGRVSHDVEVGLTQGQQADVGTLVLPIANLTISGVVVDIDGNPVPGAAVDCHGEGQRGTSTRSDAAGQFILENVSPGQVNLRVGLSRAGKGLSGRMITEGGASGVRVVVREGRSPLQYHRSETYEETVASSARVIAGVAVDESGAPVAGVPVGVCCHKRIREDGRTGWHYSSFSTLRATTDGQGRFAIVLEEDGEYSLLLSPDRHAATIVYDVPVNTKDLKVTLETGGTLVGRLVRLDGTRKVPIGHAEVKLEQTDRAAYSHLGFDRDRTMLTDDQGRFRFEHIQMNVRPMTSRTQAQWSPIPRVWQVVYGATTQTFAFTDGPTIEDFELLIKLDIDAATPLTGNPLPGFEGLSVDLGQDRIEGKAILVCFFDYQQRPSRNCVMQLVRQAEALTQKGIVVVAIQAAQVEPAAFEAWTKNSSVPFPVGTIADDIDSARAVWHVKSLPWLVLTDPAHTVVAEGFGIDELDGRLKSEADNDR